MSPDFKIKYEEIYWTNLDESGTERIFVCRDKRYESQGNQGRNRRKIQQEGKQRKGNIEDEKRTVDLTKFEFCNEITRRCDGNGGQGRGGEGNVGMRGGR